MPVAPRRMVWRVLQCPSTRGISSLCFSCALLACWVEEASNQFYSQIGAGHLIKAVFAR